jgi:hypothetical protein
MKPISVAPTSSQPFAGYTPATAFDAEGARVAILTCEVCGAAVLFDPRESFLAVERHKAWHRVLDARTAPKAILPP